MYMILYFVFVVGLFLSENCSSNRKWFIIKICDYSYITSYIYIHSRLLTHVKSFKFVFIYTVEELCYQTSIYYFETSKVSTKLLSPYGKVYE